MNNLVISYDLFKQGQNYDAVIAAIKGLSGTWAKIHKSVWYIKTPLSAAQVRDQLQRVIDSNDSLFVVDASNNDAAWYNLTDNVSNYLKQNWGATPQPAGLRRAAFG